MQKRKQDRPLVVILSQLIEDSLRELGAQASTAECETIATFVARAMSTTARDYHGPEHAIDVARGLKPLPCLAALFHDIVYLQVDAEQGRWIDSFIAPAKIRAPYEWNVREALQLTQDRELLFCASIFGFQNRDKLTTAEGLNELLSAFVFYKTFSPFLAPKLLLQGVACIESTIPFRGRTMTPSPCERLRERLISANEQFGAKLSAREIDQTLEFAEELEGRDVSFFGTAHPRHFLADTWRLVYEQNPELRSPYFSVVELRRAVQGQFQFLSRLSPKDFSWRRDRTDARFFGATESNLRLSRLYLQSQLLSLSIIEAIALATGGDGPWELFYGSQKKSREDEPLNLDELLLLSDDETEVELENSVDEEKRQIYKLLKKGRSLRSRFDRKTNYLAAYLFANLKEDEFNSAFGSALGLFQRLLKPEAHLRAFPMHILDSVLMGVAQIAQTRAISLDELKAKLATDHDRAA